jgi:quercetin 2,3-dioxygenase
VQPIATDHNAFTYTYRGKVSIAGTSAADRQMAILTNNKAIAVCIEAVEDSRLLIVAGRPLKEPIVQQGPFVMNTTAQIYQAMRDYQAGKFETAVVQSL